MPPLRKSPHHMFSGLPRRPSAKAPFPLDTTRSASAPASSSLSTPASPYPADDSPRAQKYKLVAATATTVLLVIAMCANFYMAVASRPVLQNSPPAWDDRGEAALMFASFGELACSMTLVTVLATIDPAYLWGVMAGLIGIGGYVVVAVVNGVGGPAVAVFCGYAVFWTAFLVELRLGWCPVLIRWLSARLGWDSQGSAGGNYSELPIASPASIGGTVVSPALQQRYTAFDDCETLYSPTTPGMGGGGEDFVVNMQDKLGEK